jgi:type VI secretion system protein ImpC
MAPSLCWITSKFFYLDHWDEMKRLPFLPHYLEEPAFAKWRNLRKIPSARWMGLSCNRFLARYPYGPDNKPRLIQFDEPQPLWVSPVWAIGSLIGQSFIKNGWPTRFTEWREIRLDGLALWAPEENKQIPTEVPFSDERIDQFVKGGILPLISMLNKDSVFLPAETTVAGGSLAYQLFLSRISQFIFWCKDNLGPGLGPADLEENLKKGLCVVLGKVGPSRPPRSRNLSKPTGSRKARHGPGGHFPFPSNSAFRRKSRNGV